MQEQKMQVQKLNGKQPSSSASSAKEPLDLEKFIEEKRNERKRITFRSKPFDVVYHFSAAFLKAVHQFSVWFLTHKFTLFLGLPLMILWIILSQMEGSHHVYLDFISLHVEFIVWWVGLGVLSSVGLGTGMHSGLLFLFPHIFMVVQGVEKCQSLQFDTLHHMWFHTFDAVCESSNPTPVSFWGIFLKVFYPCMLWGAGTAMGEIPPYAISRAAKIAGEKNSEFEEITETQSSYNFLNQMKTWMINFLQNHGFWGVLLMSAWPNMAFDLCGICCGHFLMPFWTFFGATFIGKALIKVNLQAAFFITLFSDIYLTKIVNFVEYITPESMELHNNLEQFLRETRSRFHTAHQDAHREQSVESKSLISVLGGYIMIALIGWFAISCIEQLAQQHAAKMHEKEIEQLRKKK